MSPVSVEVAHAITQKMARYTRYVDTKQWDKLEKEIALPDARFVYIDTNGKELRVGKAVYAFTKTKDLVNTLRVGLEGKQILHMIGPGDFEQTAPNEVTAIFSLEDQTIVPTPFNLVEVRGGGYYYGTWRDVDGEWFIVDLRMERIYHRMTLLAQIGLFIMNTFGL
jgi:hypothetical protein